MFTVLRFEFTPETCILGPSVNSLWLDLIRALVDEETDYMFEDREQIADLVKLSFEAFLDAHSLKDGEEQFFEGILFCYEFRSSYSQIGTVRQLFPQVPRLDDVGQWRLAEKTTGNLYEFSPTTQVLRQVGLSDRVIRYGAGHKMIHWLFSNKKDHEIIDFPKEHNVSCTGFMNMIRHFLESHEIRPIGKDEKKMLQRKMASVALDAIQKGKKINIPNDIEGMPAPQVTS